ncbi:hypothetical protein RRG08_058675 [Elysia crispata]|uniref:Uncharacterized protein n=1 Tax=Elysia crispata TaxID=231223 RepID=A0AAE0YWJ7_9GAST|nr:hypothetical protein RRG08_058675 [Elysia crispata]
MNWKARNSEKRWHGGGQEGKELSQPEPLTGTVLILLDDPDCVRHYLDAGFILGRPQSQREAISFHIHFSYTEGFNVIASSSSVFTTYLLFLAPVLHRRVQCHSIIIFRVHNLSSVSWRPAKAQSRLFLSMLCKAHLTNRCAEFLSKRHNLFRSLNVYSPFWLYVGSAERNGIRHRMGTDHCTGTSSGLMFKHSISLVGFQLIPLGGSTTCSHLAFRSEFHPEESCATLNTNNKSKLDVPSSWLSL